MRMIGKALVLAAALAVAAPMGATAARAQTGITLGATAPEGAEARHQEEMQAAMEAFQREGYAGLRPHLPRLRAALDAAPKPYPTIEALSDSEWVVRSNDTADALVLSMMASGMAQQQSPDKAVSISARPNVYPMIALILGSEAVERGAMDEAIGYLDQGLALQPGNVTLTAEKMAAMQAKGLMAEALALGDAAAGSGGLLALSEGMGILHRRRGFSLIELGRLDEARAAFNESLEHDPDNPAALNELRYIDGLEAGQPATPGIAVAPPSR